MNEQNCQNISEDPLLSSETSLQLAYSTALVRFVNNLTSAATKFKDSMYLTAHKQNIPDWVINLRHDVAHSASLPPLPLLHQAIHLARQWLIVSLTFSIDLGEEPHRASAAIKIAH